MGLPSPTRAVVDRDAVVVTVAVVVDAAGRCSGCTCGGGARRRGGADSVDAASVEINVWRAWR